MNTVRRMVLGLTREHPRVSKHQIDQFLAALEVAFENEGEVVNARVREVLDSSRVGRRGTCCWRPNGNDRRNPHHNPLLLGVLNLGSIPLTAKQYLCLFKVLTRHPIFKELHLHAGSVTNEVGHALLELQAEQVELSHLRGVASTKSDRLNRKLEAIQAFSYSGGGAAFERRANLKQKLRGASKNKGLLAKISASAVPGDGRGGGSGEEKGEIGSSGLGDVVAAADVVLAPNGGADGGRGAEGAGEGNAAEGAAGSATEGVGRGEETKGSGVNGNDGNDDARPSRSPFSRATRAETVSQHAPVWLIQVVNFTKETRIDQIQRVSRTKVGKLAKVVVAEEDAILDTSVDGRLTRKNIEAISTLCYIENCVLESARVFADIDTDGNGTINRAALVKAMKEQYHGITMPMDDVTRVFDYIDTDHSGHVSKGEFLNAVARRCKNSIRVKDVRDELHKIVPPNTRTLNPNSDIMQVCNM